MADRWDLLASSWMHSLRARNLAPKTLSIYGEAVDRLGEHLLGEGVHDPAEVTRAHVEGFLVAQLERLQPATVSSRYRALQQWFTWLEAEEETGPSPMRHMRPPTIPERLVDVLDEDQMRALLKACAGKDLRSRRDEALIRMFLDTGVRLAEMASMTTETTSLEELSAIVVGKGRRERQVFFGAKTAAALDRYLRVRARERLAGELPLWLGAKGKGALTSSGIAQAIGRRGEQAGIAGLHPHMFRHTFASTWMQAGGGETDLMALAGWRSRQMLSRYGASAAAARARSAHRRLGLGDRL